MKSNGTIFSTRIIYLSFFIVYPSFHAWHTWSGQYELCYFLLDFDHWLHPSDTLKMATSPKADVASVWCMQFAWMTARHGEDDPYWRGIGIKTAGINYYNWSKTCHHTQIDSFVTSWGWAQSKEAIQDHWLVDYSTVSALGAYAIVTKRQAVHLTPERPPIAMFITKRSWRVFHLLDVGMAHMHWLTPPCTFTMEPVRHLHPSQTFPSDNAGCQQCCRKGSGGRARLFTHERDTRK